MPSLCWGAWPVRPTTASRVEKGQSPAQFGDINHCYDNVIQYQHVHKLKSMVLAALKGQAIGSLAVQARNHICGRLNVSAPRRMCAITTPV